jgi:hypothetical protein
MYSYVDVVAISRDPSSCISNLPASQAVASLRCPLCRHCHWCLFANDHPQQLLYARIVLSYAGLDGRGLAALLLHSLLRLR